MTDPVAPPFASHVHAAQARLARIATEHAPSVFASSFGAEDMVLLDLIARAGLPIRVFTLDTGRLPQETYDLIDRARAHYGRRIDVYLPRANAVEAFVTEHGVNAFRGSIDMRLRCCALRKREPLVRALAGAGR